MGTLVGMVLISLGAAIADIMQCCIVSRKGYGSMAISNSIGSQILNICVGLGLPWFIDRVKGGYSFGDRIIASDRHYAHSCHDLQGEQGSSGSVGTEERVERRMKGWIMMLTYVVSIVVYAVISLRS